MQSLITGTLPQTRAGTTVEATIQASEQTPFDSANNTTVWYKWSAPSTGWYSVSVSSPAGLDAVLGVWEGTSLSNLKIVAGADQGYAGDGELVTVHVSASAFIYIQVAGFEGDANTFYVDIAAATAPTTTIPSLSFAPGSLNVAAANQNSTVTMNVVSAPGFLNGYIIFQKATANNQLGYATFAAANRTSGTAANGNYSFTATFPRYAQPGSYRPLISITRSDNTTLTFGWNQEFSLMAATRTALITLTNVGSVDSAAPSLTLNNFSPIPLDIRSGSAAGNLNLTITDALSGLNYGQVDFYELDGTYMTSEFFDVTDAQSGTAQNGTYAIPFSITSQVSTSRYYEITLADRVGNVRFYDGFNTLYPTAGQESGEFYALATGYDLWYFQNDLTGGDDEDGDLDTLPALLEYAFDLNPALKDYRYVTTTNSSGLPLVAVSGTGASRRLLVIYARRKATEVPGITYTVQFSNDPATGWGDSTSAGAVSPGTNGMERVSVFDSQLLSEAPKRFARVKVTVLP